MTTPKLLLLPVHYPFDHGEAFLQAEIPYLARAFDVTIIPLAQASDVHNMREVPPGVHVDSGISEAIPRNAIKTSLWFLRHPKSIFNLLNLAWKDRKRHSFQWARIKYFVRFASQSLIFATETAKKYRNSSISMVYSYWLSQGALATALLKQQDFAPVAISRAHGGDIYEERSVTQGYLPAQEKTITDLDEVICISEHGAAYLKEKYPAQEKKIIVSRLGVPPAPVRNQPSQDGQLHLVSCSYLVPIKRIDLLLQALNLCDFPIVWTHLGGGPLQQHIEKQARNLPANIQWRITGVLPHSQILQFYQENPVDLFINLSVSEGLPVSIMEAMSYGIPVAATDVGGTGELVHDEENGILLPADVTAQQVAETLRQAFQWPETRKNSLREEAFQTWKHLVNAENQFGEFTDHLTEMVRDASPDSLQVSQ